MHQGNAAEGTQKIARLVKDANAVDVFFRHVDCSAVGTFGGRRPVVEMQRSAATGAVHVVKYSMKSVHHKGTEAQRRTNSKLKPERTEVAEGTEGKVPGTRTLRVLLHLCVLGFCFLNLFLRVSVSPKKQNS
jgi:hypothetical protein